MLPTSQIFGSPRMRYLFKYAELKERNLLIALLNRAHIDVGT